MAATGSRSGRHASLTEPVKRYPQPAEWGTRHWLHESEWGTRSWFVGSGEKAFKFKDPDTGVTVTIRANNVEEARRQARNHGLVIDRKKRKRR